MRNTAGRTRRPWLVLLLPASGWVFMLIGFQQRGSEPALLESAETATIVALPVLMLLGIIVTQYAVSPPTQRRAGEVPMIGASVVGTLYLLMVACVVGFNLLAL